MLANNRKALAIAFVLASLSHLVSSTSSGFSFVDSCVNGCVGNSGCGTNSPKCMCKAARSNLMEPILVCMFWHCGDQLRDADNMFLGPFQKECDSINSPIPESKLKSAQRIATALVSKLGPAPTATASSLQTTTQPLPASTPQPTTKQSSTTLSKATEQLPSTSSPVKNTPTTSVHRPSNSSTEAPSPAPSPTSQASSSAADAPDSEPTDSSPFATPRGSAGQATAPLGWVVAPLVLSLLFR